MPIELLLLKKKTITKSTYVGASSKKTRPAKTSIGICHTFAIRFSYFNLCVYLKFLIPSPILCAILLNRHRSDKRTADSVGNSKLLPDNIFCSFVCRVFINLLVIIHSLIHYQKKNGDIFTDDAGLHNCYQISERHTRNSFWMSEKTVWPLCPVR